MSHDSPPRFPPAPGFPRQPPPGRSFHRGPSGRGYTLGSKHGWAWIECEHCGRVSMHVQDVAWRYCGGSLCHTFLDDPVGPGFITPPTFSDGVIIAQAVARARAEARGAAARAAGGGDRDVDLGSGPGAAGPA